ncbi:MAG: hypothetical protein AVDCRST_MAG03-3129, partial [uncultured Rubrobacteraceae bacterium]
WPVPRWRGRSAGSPRPSGWFWRAGPRRWPRPAPCVSEASGRSRTRNHPRDGSA